MVEDATRRAGAAVEGRVVGDDQATVGGNPEVDLDRVVRGDCSLDCAKRILDEGLVVQAAMGDRPPRQPLRDVAGQGFTSITASISTETPNGRLATPNAARA